MPTPCREGSLDMKRARHFIKEEGGVTSIEYALIAVSIAMVILGSVKLVGQSVVGLYGKVVTAFLGL